ncbi:MAG: hypothetical protein J6Y02_23725 [Pseudobutyrivibrio sp.]|nr:hypothetical protein [Pseudobutyrivibrio sp.]
MAIVDSLKKLLTRFGGDVSALEENATSSDVIDAISEAYIDKEGTYTEVTPIGSEGTKIATIRTNNTDHDIYAPKELPAVTAEDAKKILAVDSNGQWIKVEDRYQVGDTYVIPAYMSFTLPYYSNNDVTQFTPLTISLPKYKSTNVKWFSFTSNTKVFVFAKDGTNVVQYQPLSDVFEWSIEYSVMGTDYICLQNFKPKQAYQSAFSNYIGEYLTIAFAGGNISFLEQKPS